MRLCAFDVDLAARPARKGFWTWVPSSVCLVPSALAAASPSSLSAFVALLLALSRYPQDVGERRNRMFTDAALAEVAGVPQLRVAPGMSLGEE